MDIARLREKIREARSRREGKLPPPESGAPREEKPPVEGAPGAGTETVSDDRAEETVREAPVLPDTGADERAETMEKDGTEGAGAPEPLLESEVSAPLPKPVLPAEEKDGGPVVSAPPVPIEREEDETPGGDVQKHEEEDDYDDEGEEPEEFIELLGFRAGGEEYAVRITDVAEILRMQGTTRVPRAPAYLLGITSLRGRMIPVLDIKQRLRLEHMTPSSAKILVLRGDGAPYGISVDSVIGVLRIKEEAIRPPLETLDEEQARFIEGVALAGEGFVSLLDLSAVSDIEFVV